MKRFTTISLISCFCFFGGVLSTNDRADAKGPIRTVAKRLLGKTCLSRRVQQTVPEQTIESVTVVESVVMTESVPLLIEDAPLLPRSSQGPVRRKICNGTTCRLE